MLYRLWSGIVIGHALAPLFLQHPAANTDRLQKSWPKPYQYRDELDLSRQVLTCRVSDPTEKETDGALVERERLSVPDSQASQGVTT